MTFFILSVKNCTEIKLSSIVITVLCEGALNRRLSVAGLDINRLYFFLFPSVMIFALKAEADDFVKFALHVDSYIRSRCYISSEYSLQLVCHLISK